MTAGRPFELVIEGVGDVVQRYYAPTLKSLTDEGKIHVTFVDQSEYWRGDERLRAKHEKFIGLLPSWRASYVDKSTGDGKKKYPDLTGHIVVVATPDSTHVDVALPWLNSPDRRQLLFVEKPLDSSLDKARLFLSKTKTRDPQIRVLDHYLARVHPLHEPVVLAGIYHALGKQVIGFSFYLLENGSGSPRIGPIENDSRVQATKHGMILDLMPHIPAVLSIFGIIETMRVTQLQVGQYTGVDGDPSKRSLIDRETFAHAGFGFLSHRPGRFIDGHAFVGKGIRGSRNLGIDGAVKLLELQGANGKKLQCDLRSSGAGSSKAWVISKDGTKKFFCNLTADPYDYLIRDAVKLLEDRFHKSQLSLPVETAKSILSALEEMRWLFKDKEKALLPQYALGAGGNEAPYLEDLLQELPFI